MINASHACELLGARVHFSGDSLIRDLWTATALWLLRLEGFQQLFQKLHPTVTLLHPPFEAPRLGFAH